MALALAAIVLGGCGTLTSFPAGGVRESRGRIVHVADGDTLTVKRGRDVVDDRLLAIDTPEKYATRYGTPRECGSLGASAFLRRFDGARVNLVADPSQAQSDRYGRLLRYVELLDGTDLGALEVRKGWAMPYRFSSPGRRYLQYRNLALRARQEARGVWGVPCDGDFHSSLPGVQDGL
jgi:micrococcal nuclease